MGQVAHGNGTIVSVVSACTLLALQTSCELIWFFGFGVASNHQEKSIEKRGNRQHDEGIAKGKRHVEVATPIFVLGKR
jgi:hypothetical protein